MKETKMNMNMKLSQATPKDQLNFLVGYFNLERHKTMVEISDLLITNERKFDGEVYRTELWAEHRELTSRYIECEESLRKINYYLSKPTIIYDKVGIRND